jgi:CelD/BcsL family acetyltransferase involved in cellulose biosynthesis
MSDAGQKVGDNAYLVEITDDRAGIMDDWEQLERDGLLTAFQTRAWLIPFYRELAPSLKASPVFVLVRDGTSRQPLMLLPLCSRRICGMTFLEFADLGVSDYNAPILAKSFNPSAAQWHELWRAILARLDRGSIIRLNNVPHMIGGQANPLAWTVGDAGTMDFSSWGFALPPTLEDYKANLLNPSFAKELAKKRRRVAKRGKVEYCVARSADERQTFFDILARQRQTRCDEMRRPNVLAQAPYLRFYQAVAFEAAGELASLSALKVDGEIVGTILALKHRDALHIIMSTFERGPWKACSLGNILIQQAIEHAIAAGLAYFDLTIGDESYKILFGATPSNLYTALQPRTPAGALVASALTFAAQLKKVRNKSPFGVKHKSEYSFRAKQSAE